MTLNLCARVYLRVICCSTCGVSEEVQGEFTAPVLMLHIFLSAGGAEELNRQGDAWGGDEDVRRGLQKRGGSEYDEGLGRGGVRLLQFELLWVKFSQGWESGGG